MNHSAKPTPPSRFTVGAACGLAIASLTVIVLTWVIDPYIWQAVHRDKNDVLTYDSWLGMEPPTFHLVSMTILIVAFVLLGLLIRRRPLLPALTKGRIVLLNLLAGIALMTAMAVVIYAHFSWMWVLLD